MGTLLAGFSWALAAAVGVVCVWRAFHCLPAAQRQRLFRQGKPQLAPIDWLGLAAVAFVLAALCGYATVTDWAGEMLDPLLAPLVRRY